MTRRVMRLPAVCIGCGAPVEWDGKRWLVGPVGLGKHDRHVCREDRPECGIWMRSARVRCARRPGHAGDHRTREALDHDRDRRRVA